MSRESPFGVSSKKDSSVYAGLEEVILKYSLEPERSSGEGRLSCI